MRLVTAIIKPHKLDDVKSALESFGVQGKIGRASCRERV